MSRGGRGGGRGGRGGRAGPQLSWDNGEHAPDTRPSELFPQYDVPSAKPLSALEQANVNSFLLFRRQFQDGPLYTRKRTWAVDPADARKLYGQDQVNSKYGVRTRGTADPFNSMPTYSQKFVRPERELPDFGSRPFCKEFFPQELHNTLDGDDVPPSERRRGGEAKVLRLSKITALPTAEDVFNMNGDEEENIGADGALEALDKIQEGQVEGEGEWEEGAEEEEEQDVEYDDEDAGDYDAENYFDDGEFGDDDGGGDDDNGGAEY